MSICRYCEANLYKEGHKGHCELTRERLTGRPTRNTLEKRIKELEEENTRLSDGWKAVAEIKEAALQFDSRHKEILVRLQDVVEGRQQELADIAEEALALLIEWNTQDLWSKEEEEDIKGQTELLLSRCK